MAEKPPLISFLQTAAVRSHIVTGVHTSTHTHRLNMAVNKIVDTFSFGTIQTEIALRVLALRIISVLPPLIEVKHEYE